MVVSLSISPLILDLLFSNLIDCYEKWLSVRLGAILLPEPSIETTSIFTVATHNPTPVSDKHTCAHICVCLCNNTGNIDATHGCTLSRQTHGFMYRNRKTHEYTSHTHSSPALFALNKPNLSISLKSHHRQKEECPRSPLQRSSLPTHCANPDDIVTMHHSPEQGPSATALVVCSEYVTFRHLTGINSTAQYNKLQAAFTCHANGEPSLCKVKD